MGMPQLKRIEIEVAGDDITIRPTAVHLSAGQQVVWVAQHDIRAFLLVFYDGAPVGKVEVRGKRGSGGPGKKACLEAFERVAPKAMAGLFHYQVMVVVQDEEGERIVAASGCPEVIVHSK